MFNRNGPKLQIREYAKSDEHMVLSIFKEFMTDLTPAGSENAFNEYINRAINEELLHIEEQYNSSEGSNFWVAVMSDTVVGMIGVQRASESEGEIRRLAVRKSKRRLGVATELMSVAESYSKTQGYKHIILDTSEYQKEAIGLYNRLNYAVNIPNSKKERSERNVGGGVVSFHFRKQLC